MASNNNLAFLSYRDDEYSIPKLCSLEILSLKKNKLAWFSFDACFHMFPNVEEIDISENELSQYTWQNISGWLHEDADQNPWPIINISGTNLDKKELCSRYAAMGIKFFENDRVGRSFETWCSMGTVVGTILGVGGGALVSMVGVNVTQDPLWLWGLSSSVVTVPLGAIMGCGLMWPCASATHDERMQVLKSAQENIRNDSIISEQGNEDIV
jgi:hypothetical protein